MSQVLDEEFTADRKTHPGFRTTVSNAKNKKNWVSPFREQQYANEEAVTGNNNTEAPEARASFGEEEEVVTGDAPVEEASQPTATESLSTSEEAAPKSTEATTTGQKKKIVEEVIDLGGGLKMPKSSIEKIARERLSKDFKAIDERATEQTKLRDLKNEKKRELSALKDQNKVNSRFAKFKRKLDLENRKFSDSHNKKIKDLENQIAAIDKKMKVFDKQTIQEIEDAKKEHEEKTEAADNKLVEDKEQTIKDADALELEKKEEIRKSQFGQKKHEITTRVLQAKRTEYELNLELLELQLREKNRELDQQKTVSADQLGVKADLETKIKHTTDLITANNALIEKAQGEHSDSITSVDNSQSELESSKLSVQKLKAELAALKNTKASRVTRLQEAKEKRRLYDEEQERIRIEAEEKKKREEEERIRKEEEEKERLRIEAEEKAKREEQERIRKEEEEKEQARIAAEEAEAKRVVEEKAEAERVAKAKADEEAAAAAAITKAEQEVKAEAQAEEEARAQAEEEAKAAAKKKAQEEQESKEAQLKKLIAEKDAEIEKIKKETAYVQKEDFQEDSKPVSKAAVVATPVNNTAAEAPSKADTPVNKEVEPATESEKKHSIVPVVAGVVTAGAATGAAAGALVSGGVSKGVNAPGGSKRAAGSSGSLPKLEVTKKSKATPTPTKNTPEDAKRKRRSSGFFNLFKKKEKDSTPPPASGSAVPKKSADNISVGSNSKAKTSNVVAAGAATGAATGIAASQLLTPTSTEMAADFEPVERSTGFEPVTSEAPITQDQEVVSALSADNVKDASPVKETEPPSLKTPVIAEKDSVAPSTLAVVDEPIDTPAVEKLESEDAAVEKTSAAAAAVPQTSEATESPSAVAIENVTGSEFKADVVESGERPVIAVKPLDENISLEEITAEQAKTESDVLAVVVDDKDAVVKHVDEVATDLPTPPKTSDSGLPKGEYTEPAPVTIPEDQKFSVVSGSIPGKDVAGVPAPVSIPDDQQFFTPAVADKDSLTPAASAGLQSTSGTSREVTPEPTTPAIGKNAKKNAKKRAAKKKKKAAAVALATTDTSDRSASVTPEVSNSDLGVVGTAVGTSIVGAALASAIDDNVNKASVEPRGEEQQNIGISQTKETEGLNSIDSPTITPAFESLAPEVDTANEVTAKDDKPIDDSDIEPVTKDAAISSAETPVVSKDAITESKIIGTSSGKSEPENPVVLKKGDEGFHTLDPKFANLKALGITSKDADTEDDQTSELTAAALPKTNTSEPVTPSKTSKRSSVVEGDHKKRGFLKKIFTRDSAKSSNEALPATATSPTKAMSPTKAEENKSLVDAVVDPSAKDTKIEAPATTTSSAPEKTIATVPGVAYPKPSSDDDSSLYSYREEITTEEYTKEELEELYAKLKSKVKDVLS